MHFQAMFMHIFKITFCVHENKIYNIMIVLFVVQQKNRKFINLIQKFSGKFSFQAKDHADKLQVFAFFAIILRIKA